MSIAPLVKVGVADPLGAATPIYADALNPPLNAAPVKVVLSVAFAQLCPPGWPSPPDETGVATASEWFPRTIPSGTTITAFACVAAALIAAGAATLA